MTTSAAQSRKTKGCQSKNHDPETATHRRQAIRRIPFFVQTDRCALSPTLFPWTETDNVHGPIKSSYGQMVSLLVTLRSLSLTPDLPLSPRRGKGNGPRADLYSRQGSPPHPLPNVNALHLTMTRRTVLMYPWSSMITTVMRPWVPATMTTISLPRWTTTTIRRT